ncbi:MAG TPA: hypothetical protein VK509_00500 [Polyangiales bacterium]|nr:hypothetical protein [Polyangiales bacterium]
MTTKDEKQPERIRVWPKPGLDILDEYSGQPIKGGDEVPYTRLTIKRLRDEDLFTEDPNSSTSKSRTHAERFGGKGDV